MKLAEQIPLGGRLWFGYRSVCYSSLRRSVRVLLRNQVLHRFAQRRFRQ
jgi:hypothetical protein